jgi:uncharacterized protein
MPVIRDNTALSRFELESDGVTVFLNYRLGDGIITLQHTETPVQARGRGLASQLVQGVLETVRARGLKIVPRCAFVQAYLAKHPEYRDLVSYDAITARPRRPEPDLSTAGSRCGSWCQPRWRR